jgi:hypothetical protein
MLIIRNINVTMIQYFLIHRLIKFEIKYNKIKLLAIFNSNLFSKLFMKDKFYYFLIQNKFLSNFIYL